MTIARHVELSPALASAVESACAWRGKSFEEYVRAALEAATRLDAELAADIKEGEDDLAAGRFYTQEQMEEMFGVVREQRRAA